MSAEGASVGPTARLSVLHSITEVGLLRLSPTDTLQEVLERLRAGLGASTATVLVLEGDAQQLVVRASAGLEAEVEAGVRVPVGKGIAGEVAFTGRGRLLADISAAQPVSEMLMTSGSRAMAAVPLTVAGSVMGVLHVTGRDAGALGGEDLSLLELLSDRVALAVERVRIADREAVAAAALRASEQRARAVLETAVDGIITIDRAGRVESMNRAAERMFGYAAEEIVGRNVSMLMPEPFRSEHDEYLARYHRTGERRIIGTGREVAGRRRDGSTFPMELAVSDVGPEVGLYMGVLRDITERKQFEAQLAHHALHDSLTGLANRALLMEQLEHALARLERHRGLVALLFLDLDRFKLVNDTLGHEAGDELLLRTAERLRSAVRPADLVARLGGDEFVILCEELDDRTDADIVARRIMEVLSVPIPLRGREVFVSASVGVVTAAGERSASELLGDADTAMYQAKERGRGRYAVYDATIGRSGDRLQLISDLHRALERDELRACYQPLVDLRTGQIMAAEALLRWAHPSRGVLGPGDFLSVVDDLGLVVQFDAWMLHAACRDAALWGRRLQRPLDVWVNLSGRSRADTMLVDTVASALERSGLHPRLLTLEITEGVLMENAEATARTLTALHDVGVQMAVDDFGTGYSSLAYLQRFPVHTLKVDRSFVDRLDEITGEGDADAAIVRAMVSLARALGLRVVAEGIETPTQLAAVTALGCEFGQGFFLGRPAARDDIVGAVTTGVLLTAGGTDQDHAG